MISTGSPIFLSRAIVAPSLRFISPETCIRLVPSMIWTSIGMSMISSKFEVSALPSGAGDVSNEELSPKSMPAAGLALPAPKSPPKSSPPKGESEISPPKAARSVPAPKASFSRSPPNCDRSPSASCFSTPRRSSIAWSRSASLPGTSRERSLFCCVFFVAMKSLFQLKLASNCLCSPKSREPTNSLNDG
ncbi:hypothetical protein RHECNPAF_1760023 [Rhizobium etli CNPAF512]|nr:hypothetical protein RHECNPAF_1760023 [Rhizobium etli CNPAF512]